MAGHPSDKDGAEGENPDRTEDGLDAKLDRAVPPVGAEAFLLGVGGTHSGRVYSLHHNTVFIGRSDDVDVCVSDPSVSARHARIINGTSGFEIEDLGSTNGTFVEGIRVNRAPLKSGDRIAIGQIEFKFLVDRRVDATIMVLPSGRVAPALPGAIVRYAPPWVPPLPPAPRPERDDEEGPSLSDMLRKLVLVSRFLRRNVRLILTFLVMGVVLGIASVVVIPPPAQAGCTVKLQSQIKQNLMDPLGNRSSDEDDTQFFAGADLAFTRKEVVSESLRMAEGRTPTESQVESAIERLRFEPLTGPGHLYRATYRDRRFGNNRPPVVEFLGLHLRNYLEFEISRALRRFKADADFLRDQLKSVEQEMNRIGGERAQYRQKNADRLPEEANLTHGSRFALEDRRATLTAQVRKLEADLESARHSLAAEGPLSQAKLQQSQVYRASLAETNRKLSEAYARGLADGHPEVIKLNDEKARLSKLVESEMRGETTADDRKALAGLQNIQGQVEGLRAQLSAARSDLSDTERKLAEVRSTVGDLPRVEERVKQLNQAQDEITTLHGQLFDRLKKAEVQLNHERVSAESRYEIVLPPALETGGFGILGAKRGALGLGLGILFAAIALAVREGKRMLKQTIADLDSDGKWEPMDGDGQGVDR